MKSHFISELVNAQGLLTCPVCGKEFKPNEDTKYMISDEYTCSWKCFLIRVNEREKERENKKQKK